jgi:CheY-like chemotaxis protein
MQHTLYLATDGERGIELALQESPDLILCDLQIPRIDGYAVVRSLQGNPRWHRVPIIAVTALSMPGDLERALGCGFHGYLTKPITPGTFAGQIEAFLPAPDQG